MRTGSELIAQNPDGSDQQEPDRVIWRPELAAVCGVQTKTVGKWVKEGRIPKPDTQISRRTQGWRASTLRKAGVSI